MHNSGNVGHANRAFTRTDGWYSYGWVVHVPFLSLPRQGKEVPDMGKYFGHPGTFTQQEKEEYFQFLAGSRIPGDTPYLHTPRSIPDYQLLAVRNLYCVLNAVILLWWTHCWNLNHAPVRSHRQLLYTASRGLHSYRTFMIYADLFILYRSAQFLYDVTSCTKSKASDNDMNMFNLLDVESAAGPLVGNNYTGAQINTVLDLLEPTVAALEKLGLADRGYVYGFDELPASTFPLAFYCY